MTTNNKWYTSSTGSGLSLTIKGLLVGIVPIIVGLARVYGYDLTENELLNFIDVVFQAVSISLVFVGLLRKLYIKLENR